jgi:hypothetical protein
MSTQDGTDHAKARDLLRVWLAEDRAMSEPSKPDERDPAAARLREIRKRLEKNREFGELRFRFDDGDVDYLLDQLAQRTAERDEARRIMAAAECRYAEAAHEMRRAKEAAEARVRALEEQLRALEDAYGTYRAYHAPPKQPKLARLLAAVESLLSDGVAQPPDSGEQR